MPGITIWLPWLCISPMGNLCMKKKKKKYDPVTPGGQSGLIWADAGLKLQKHDAFPIICAHIKRFYFSI